jgi:hypothetical protein
LRPTGRGDIGTRSADLRNAYDALMARFKGVFSVAAPSIWNLLAVLDQAVADDFDALNVLLLC